MLLVRVNERGHQQYERGNGDERENAHGRGLALGSPIDQRRPSHAALRRKVKKTRRDGLPTGLCGQKAERACRHIRQFED
jgi:hypothetical protein